VGLLQVGQAEACPHSGHMRPVSVGTGFSLSRYFHFRIVSIVPRDTAWYVGRALA
jgi:hypothetical protein